ncbi:MAG: hypothetical protein H0Z39_11275 [Peptococcaceae bacterium]|nr:hypothetical protein [Peptococcaceae bacterium]
MVRLLKRFLIIVVCLLLVLAIPTVAFGSYAYNYGLMIVNPNYRWTESFVEHPTESRLALVIPFTKSCGHGEIWVDAYDGTMLGGNETD